MSALTKEAAEVLRLTLEAKPSWSVAIATGNSPAEVARLRKSALTALGVDPRLPLPLLLGMRAPILDAMKEVLA